MAGHHYLTTIISLMILISLCIGASASDLDIPNEFKDGEPAYADQINQNFQAVEAAVDDNQQQIDGKLSAGGGTIFGNLTVTGNLTASSLTLSDTKLGSVTYSASGFTPRESPSVDYILNRGGYLVLSESTSAYFYHAVTLQSGVTMTHLRAHVQDRKINDDRDIEILLRKRELGKPAVTLASINSIGRLTNNLEHIIEAELPEPEFIAGRSPQDPQDPPVTYFIEVNLDRQDVRFFSVTIDYERTEP
jgi:hypothetical protein